MWTAIISLALLTLALGAYVYSLRKQLRSLEDEVTNMKYIRVEKNGDGSYTIKSQDGKTIFDL